MKKFFTSLFLITTICAQKADLIIFSYDRPLQAYALLESAEQHVTGIEKVVVLFRASNPEYEQGYEEVAKQFPDTKFIQQSHRYAKEDFKPLLMKALSRECRSPYLFFAVDDIVIKDQIDLPLCISYLEKYKAEGFHLRMGKNLDYCYTEQSKQPLPPLTEVEEGVLRWRFSQGKHDWRYPHTVDCCVFRKKQILKDFSSMRFSNPNTLEAKWATRCDFSRFGLCFETSKIVNLPLNLVNETYKNVHLNSFTPKDLLKIFNDGKKMDIMQLYQIENRSAHIDYEPSFTERTSRDTSSRD
ncbi:MAG: hypothetical protein SNF33_04155 [Candidatus Algichlamydia australiensis]|nr:hypothetical protein [Chlamydiales bacterium]